ncbi:hypothetical protein [Bordetella avium]|uniref:hypothetical protein n=1 Tax=Bordetella avium TaxID=521 RepID=UPI0019D4B2D7|nr:hypothetical protein [Bordetella avium]
MVSWLARIHLPALSRESADRCSQTASVRRGSTEETTMQCDCISRVEHDAKKHLQPQIKGPISSVRMANVAFVIDGSEMDARLYIPIHVKADAPGYRSQYGKAVPMHVSFCPFCGKSAKRINSPPNRPDSSLAGGGDRQ